MSPSLFQPLITEQEKIGLTPNNPICRPTDEEILITRMLEKVLRRSDAVDREALCIVAGQQVLFTLQQLPLIF